MTRDKKEKFFSPKKLILNPGMISLIIGLPLFFFDIKPPETVMTALSHIANLNTPLAMLFLGTYIANTDMKNMFSSYENYLASFLKLAALPLSMLLIFKLMGVSGELLTALIISASAPSANNTVMFSAKYGVPPSFARFFSSAAASSGAVRAASGTAPALVTLPCAPETVRVNGLPCFSDA